MKVAARWMLIAAAVLLAAGQGQAQNGAGIGDLDALLKPAADGKDAVKPAAPVAAPVAATLEAAPAAAAAAPAAAEAAPAKPVVAAAPVEAAVPAEAAPAAAPAPVAAITPAANSADEHASMVSELVTLERLRRSALREHGMTSLDAARKALRDGDYEAAKTQYEMAISYIPDSPETRSMRDEAKEGVREALYQDARLQWKKGDREKAVQLARQAQDKGQPDATKLVAQIQKEIDNPPKAQAPLETPRILEASHKDDRDEVMRHLRLARQHFIVGEYDLTRQELEIILRDHPYQTEAIEMLNKVSARMHDVSKEEFEATRTKMIRDVTATWTPRTYAIDTVQIKEPGAGRTTEGTTVTTGGITVEKAVEEKMRRIVLPEINFRNANINDVIPFFESASREYDDPGVPAEKRGVNFVLKHGGGTSGPVAAPAASNDPFAAAASTDNSAGAGSGAPITFSARFVSLWEALKIVTEVGGFKFRVKSNLVIIMPSSMPETDLETRSYTVMPTLSERVASVGKELTTAKTTGGTTGGGFEGMAASTDMAEKQDWKEFFGRLGVTWPQGSSISYLATIGKLRVVNTADNLAIFEQVLEELNVTPRQVEIEARFVEVSQNDLNSLGVEWQMNKPINLFGTKGSVPTDSAGSDGTIHYPYPLDNAKYGVGVNTPDNGNTAANFTKGLRFLGTGAAGVTSGSGTAIDSVLSLHGVLDNLDMTTVLHMLSQRDNTDLLSAPKVVTKSGQEAVMKVVKEYIYPTQYTVTTFQSTGQNGQSFVSGAAVEPGSFQTREVGVILQVVPEVSAEGQMINLTLSPQVVSDPEWFDYGYDMPVGNPVTGTTHIFMRQPFFPVRSISTSVSIYNGATVVMGGMITEQRTTSEDKVPFLGDLPYLGNLFKSTASTTDKRNLLIFVTARLVDPAGRSVKTTGDQALGGDKLKSMLAPGAKAN